MGTYIRKEVGRWFTENVSMERIVSLWGILLWSFRSITSFSEAVNILPRTGVYRKDVFQYLKMKADLKTLMKKERKRLEREFTRLGIRYNVDGEYNVKVVG